MTWEYNGKEFNSEDIGEYTNFVYMITNLVNNKKYIGKKTFISTRRLQPLKGKTRKRKVVKESDWKEYYGSNDNLKEDVKKFGPQNFKREILRLCKSKGEASYYEAAYQFEHEVLLREDYYNNWITCKVTGSHLLR